MTPKRIIERLELVVGSTGQSRPLRGAIELELASFFNLPTIQAAERAESVEVKVATMIAARAVACENDGTSPVITVLGSSSNIVAGFCLVLPTDSEHVTSIKQQRIHAAAILLPLELSHSMIREIRISHSR